MLIFAEALCYLCQVSCCVCKLSLAFKFFPLIHLILLLIFISILVVIYCKMHSEKNKVLAVIGDEVFLIIFIYNLTLPCLHFSNFISGYLRWLFARWNWRKESNQESNPQFSGCWQEHFARGGGWNVSKLHQTSRCGHHLDHPARCGNNPWSNRRSYRCHAIGGRDSLKRFSFRSWKGFDPQESSSNVFPWINLYIFPNNSLSSFACSYDNL